MNDFDRLIAGPSTLREPELEIDQKGLDRYDYLMVHHATFDDRQEFHVLMNLIMDGKIQPSLRWGVNYTKFYDRAGNSLKRVVRLPLSLSSSSQILNKN